MTNSLELTLSVSGDRLMATVPPASNRTQLDVDAVRRMLGEVGYGDWLLLEDAVAALVEHYNSRDGELEVAVAERRDASFSVEVSADAMAAWVNWVPAYGGKGVTADDVFAALAKAGVSYGIDEAAVTNLCSKGLPERVAVATGLAPEHGRDTMFELLVADSRDRVPHVNEKGLMDFRDLGAIPLVVADQALMRRIPPTDGKHGRTIRGELVDPVPGRNEGFAEHLVGAYVAKDDPDLLLAVFNGQPVRCARGVTVEQILKVRNVNLASGNINFDGTVHVDGEVMPGMKVSATGDITVSGLVDGGELDAGGDIVIGGGIIAQAKVRAAGSVAARFAENAHIYAGTTIVIGDSALQSDLQAMNQIVIGAKSPQRGRLTGGSTRAMLLVQVPILGAPTGGVTGVHLGVNPVLEARYQDLLHQIEKQKADEAKLEQIIKHLSKQGDQSGTLERVKATWQQTVQAWGRLLAEKEALEAQLTLIAGARLVVGVALSGAVDLSFGKKALHLRRSFDAGTISVDDDRIVFTDPGGNVTAAA